MMMVVAMRVIMAVTVMMSAGQQPRAGDIDRQTKHGDRDRLVEADGNRIEQPRYGFITDQQRNHRQNDGAGVSRQVAEFAGTEGETAIVGIFAGIGVSQRGQQQRSGMRRHMQSVGNKRQRAEQSAADDFGDHHDAAKDDHRPGPAFGFFVVFAQKDVIVRRAESSVGIGHGCSSLQIGVDHFDELIRRLGVKRAGIPVGVDEMGADVVLDHLRHQAGNAAADARDHVHDALASRLFGQRPLDRFNLAPNAAYPGKQLLLLSDRVCHGAQI